MTTTNTTAEMAIRLKAAGWPQPEMKFGQVWADAGINIILTRITKNTIGFDYDGGYFDRAKRFGFDDLAYCPSVIELMQALANLNADPQLEMHKGLFFARFETLDDLQCQSGHNAADLFGELWLKIKTT